MYKKIIKTATKITILGKGFGNDLGKVTLGDLEVIVYQWSEGEIIVQSLPMPPKNYSLKVFVKSQTCGFSYKSAFVCL